eukprot:scaffold61500_cov20-Tisochrysis_lutea.AAC.1
MPSHVFFIALPGSNNFPCAKPIPLLYSYPGHCSLLKCKGFQGLQEAGLQPENLADRERAAARNAASPPSAPAASAPARTPARAAHAAAAPAGASNSKPKRARATAGDRSELSSFDELEDSDLEERPGQAARGTIDVAGAHRASRNGTHARKRLRLAGVGIGRGNSQDPAAEAARTGAEREGQVPTQRLLPLPASRPSLMPQGSPQHVRPGASWLQQQQQQQQQVAPADKQHQLPAHGALKQERLSLAGKGQPPVSEPRFVGAGLLRARCSPGFSSRCPSPHRGPHAANPHTRVSPPPAHSRAGAELAARATPLHVSQISRGRAVKVEEGLQGAREAYRAVAQEQIQQQEKIRAISLAHAQAQTVQQPAARLPPAAQAPPAAAHA